MQSHVVTWLWEDLHMEVVENILVEMMIFLECHGTDLLSCCGVCRSISKQAEAPQSDWVGFFEPVPEFLSQAENVCLGSSLRM
jgi:hypothetical protein